MDELKAIQESPEYVMGDPKAREKYYQILFGRYCFNPEKVFLLNLCMSPKALLGGSKVFDIFVENLLSKPFDFHPEVKKIKVPTLIVHRDSDIFPPMGAQKLHETISGSRYVLIHNCGHFPYVEAPEELFKAINEFLHGKTFP